MNPERLKIKGWFKGQFPEHFEQIKGCWTLKDSLRSLISDTECTTRVQGCEARQERLSVRTWMVHTVYVVLPTNTQQNSYYLPVEPGTCSRGSFIQISTKQAGASSSNASLALSKSAPNDQVFVKVFRHQEKFGNVNVGKLGKIFILNVNSWQMYQFFLLNLS